MKAGAVYKYDFSLPVEKMYNLVEEMRIKLGKTTQYGYLHFEVLFSFLLRWEDVSSFVIGWDGVI